jgi:hypothetical protein
MSAIDAVDGSSTGTWVPWKWALLRPHDSEEPIMQAVKTIGLDIAKSIFQVHGVNADGQVVIRRKLKRRLHRNKPAFYSISEIADIQ